MDQKSSEILVNDLYAILSNLNPTYKETFKKQKLKSPSKQTFTELFAELLSIYGGNISGLSFSDEETVQFVKDLGRLTPHLLGYPYFVREDCLRIVGAPHNWAHVLSILHFLAQTVEFKLQEDKEEANKQGSDEMDLLNENFEPEPAPKEEDIFEVLRKGIEKRLTAAEMGKNYLQQQK